MKPKSAQAHHEGAVEKLRALGSMDYHPEIKKRRSEFAKLVAKLSKDHQIGDRKVLVRAIDISVRMYHDNDVLSKRDSALLLKHIPKVTSVLMYPGNDKRIADLLVRREDARIRRGKYDPVTHGNAFLWVTQIGKCLAELERSLKTRPRRSRPPDVRLHSAIDFLSRYWQDLPTKRLTRTFTPNDPKAGRQLAKSEAMKFNEEVMNFIDPAAVRRLQARHGIGYEVLPKLMPKACLIWQAKANVRSGHNQ